MSSAPTIEAVLAQALLLPHYPPRLAEAMRYAVFPGGGRLRPKLCAAVAAACGGITPACAHAAAAVELLHCASLVHDDMPCFDAALERRGAPTVHRKFGEALAVLVGDGLIIAAFGLATQLQPFPLIHMELSRAAGLLVAGQGWESEPTPDMAAYHAAKTGALFEAAAVCGALSTGMPGEPWRDLGRTLGRAYQLADDISDVNEDSNQPNHAQVEGLFATQRRLQDALAAARHATPAHAAELDGWFVALASHMPF